MGGCASGAWTSVRIGEAVVAVLKGLTVSLAKKDTAIQSSRTNPSGKKH